MDLADIRLPLLFRNIAFVSVSLELLDQPYASSNPKACIAFFPTGTILVLLPLPVTMQVRSLRSKSSVFKAHSSDNLNQKNTEAPLKPVSHLYHSTGLKV